MFTVCLLCIIIFYPWHSDHLYKTVSQNDDDVMLLKKARKYWLMLENFKAYWKCNMMKIFIVNDASIRSKNVTSITSIMLLACQAWCQWVSCTQRVTALLTDQVEIVSTNKSLLSWVSVLDVVNRRLAVVPVHRVRWVRWLLLPLAVQLLQKVNVTWSPQSSNPKKSESNHLNV